MPNSPDVPSEREKKKVNRHGWDHDYFEDRFFGAVYLIIIGVIFLLNTTGVLPWSLWINILKFWPLFIVSAGIGIIFGGTRVLKFIGSSIGLIIFLVIVALAIFNPFVNGWSFIPSTINTQKNTEDYVIKNNEYFGLTSRNFTIDLPFGEVVINDDNSKDYLTTKTQYSSENEKLSITKSVDNNSLNINIKNQESNQFNIVTQGPKYSIEAGSVDLPTSFILKFGAGNAVLDFEDLVIRDFKAEVGAGNLEAEFSEVSVPSQLDLKSGLGNVKITLPKEVGLKINYKVGLGNISINNQNLGNGSEDGTTSTSNYDISEKRIILNVEVGLGNIEIVTK